MTYRPMQPRGGRTDLSRVPRPPPKPSPSHPNRKLRRALRSDDTQAFSRASVVHHRSAQRPSWLRRSIRPKRAAPRRGPDVRVDVAHSETSPRTRFSTSGLDSWCNLEGLPRHTRNRFVNPRFWGRHRDEMEKKRTSSSIRRLAKRLKSVVVDSAPRAPGQPEITLPGLPRGFNR
jgi:hypothetical protein